MAAMTLPPVNPAPIPTLLVAPSAPGFLQATTHATGPGSFSQLMQAADARRQAEPSKPAFNAAFNAASSPENKAQQAQAGSRPQAPTNKTPPRDNAKTERRSGATDAEENTAERSAAAAAAEASGDDDSTPSADAASLLLAGLDLIQRSLSPAETGSARSQGRLMRLAQDAAHADHTEAQLARTGAGGAAGAIGADGVLDAAAVMTTGGATDRSSAGKSFAGLLAAAQGADAASGTASATSSLGAAFAAAEQRLAAVEGRPADGAAPGSLALHGAVPGGPAVGSSSALPAEGRLSATPGQAGFAEQLGAQLSTFVREGVQHARLQLHPLELGPLTVQIELDGGSARMSFAAEHAQTRQALEQALPMLAGSLREAGLTLSGGGVFEQPRQPQPEADNRQGGGHGGRNDGRNDGNGGGTDALSAAAAGPALRRRGVVDLVA